MSRKQALVALSLLAVLAAAVGTASAVVPNSVPAEEPITDGAAGDNSTAVDDEFPIVTAVPNTTNYLSVETTDRAAFVRSDVDVTAAAGMSAQRLQARHDNAVFDARIDTPETNHVVVVREQADSIEARLDRLDARHDALLTAYSNGSLSRETTLRRLARLSVRAETNRDRLQHVSDRVEDDPGVSVPVRLETRLSDLATVLVTLPNPVADRVEAGLAGQRDPSVVYAGGAENALVLGTVEDGEFIRTATVRDDYAPDQSDQFETSEERDVIAALQRGGDLYPWVYENDIGGPQIRGFGNTGVYLISVEYSHGTLQTYLSGGSTNAFHEIQTQNPEGVPVTGATSNATEALNVTVETTVDSGPMRVRLIQPASGAPLDGTVRVNGQVVGQTGDDGTMWTVQPAGQFRVNASTDANSVAVTVS